MSKLFSWVWTKLLPLHGCDIMCFGGKCLWFDLLSSDVTSCKVICGTTPVLLCTTKNYNILLQYYSLQYYSVLQSTTPILQSTTPVLLCTTKYCASTTKYYASTTLYYKNYKVLRQHYSVLQSTTPVLLCTTKYYSGTTLYYISTTLYYSSTTLYYKGLCQRTTPVLLWNVIYNAWSK